MKEYVNEYKKVPVLDKIICDMCHKEIKKNNVGNYVDYFHLNKTWGYDSSKDGRTDDFDICEECYDKILKLITK